MRDTTSLTILQYNVRNERVTTMIPLLADQRLQNYDVVAIQEPWRNPYGATTLSSHKSGFHLLYKAGGDTRVCFYVNEKIDTESWEVEFPSSDLCTLKMRLRHGGAEKHVHIHNIYNPSPPSYSSTDGPSTLPELKIVLEAPVEHIVIGDFN